MADKLERTSSWTSPVPRLEETSLHRRTISASARQLTTEKFWNVMLQENVREERKLREKLKKLDKERNVVEAECNWLQREFVMKHIFDKNFNIRQFVGCQRKGKSTYRISTLSANMAPTGKSSSCSKLYTAETSDPPGMTALKSLDPRPNSSMGNLSGSESHEDEIGDMSCQSDIGSNCGSAEDITEETTVPFGGRGCMRRLSVSIHNLNVYQESICEKIDTRNTQNIQSMLGTRPKSASCRHLNYMMPHLVAANPIDDASFVDMRPRSCSDSAQRPKKIKSASLRRAALQRAASEFAIKIDGKNSRATTTASGHKSADSRSQEKSFLLHVSPFGKQGCTLASHRPAATSEKEAEMTSQKIIRRITTTLTGSALLRLREHAKSLEDIGQIGERRKELLSLFRECTNKKISDDHRWQRIEDFIVQRAARPKSSDL